MALLAITIMLLQLYHDIFRTLVYLISEAYSKTLSNIWDEAYWEPWHFGTAFSGLFWYLRGIQQYSAMVRHIEGY